MRDSPTQPPLHDDAPGPSEAESGVERAPARADGVRSAATKRRAARPAGDAPAGTAATALPPSPVVAVDAPGSALPPHQLRAVVESLLFVAGRPMEFAELRRLLGIDEARARAAVVELGDDLERSGRGVRAQWTATSAQLVSAPEHARFVAALLGLPTQVRLTTAALETLSVIAYRQPITRGQIEAIRGVNSDRALASLLQHGLAQEVGRAATVGRPVLFGTTPEFLQQFGLASLEALPRPDLPQAEIAAALRERAAESIRAAVNAGDEAEARFQAEEAARSGPLGVRRRDDTPDGAPGQE